MIGRVQHTFLYAILRSWGPLHMQEVKDKVKLATKAFKKKTTEKEVSAKEEEEDDGEAAGSPLESQPPDNPT